MIYFPKNEKNFPTKCFQLSPNISTLLAPSPPHPPNRNPPLDFNLPLPLNHPYDIKKGGGGENNNNNLIINASPLRKDWGGKEGVE